jgi:hypothetical protein
LLRINSSLETHFSEVLNDPHGKQRFQAMLNSPVILWNFFNSMVHDSRFRSLHCVLDGLDECSAEAISFITQRLDELNSTDGFPPPTRFRLIVVSRNEVGGMQRFTRILLDPPQNELITMDTKRFISRKMATFSAADISGVIVEDIERVLSERDEGTFLWLSFAFEELRQKETPTQMLLALDEIPRGLPAVHDRTLVQLPPEYIGICREILS